MFMIRQFIQSDLDDVIHLWEICGLTRPWNNPELDIFRKLVQQDDLFLVAIKDEQLIAVLMGGYDGHRGWMNYLAVHPQHQRLGIATALVQQLEKRLIARAVALNFNYWFVRIILMSKLSTKNSVMKKWMWCVWANV